jgi:2-C-methyl-D-erythritol 4-phosphate cytidylyltransferase
MSVVGIVPAAGRGERLGADGPKAFVVCAGRPLIDWSLDVLHSVCDRVVVAVPPGFPLGPDRVEGGPVRSDSVRRALATAPEATVVVVHDAARPFVTRELVERCIAALDEADGAIAASPVTDTIKEVDSDQRVTRTLDRSSLWAIQTPQVFKAAVLRDALDVPLEALTTATDDASLVEAAGGIVRVVESPPRNLKVTTVHDLQRAEALLAS